MSNNKPWRQTNHFRVGKTKTVVSAKARTLFEAVDTLRHVCARRRLFYLPDYREQSDSRPATLPNRKGVMR
jgi:hypothetical protein